jgi:hypothetical protein
MGVRAEVRNSCDKLALNSPSHALMLDIITLKSIALTLGIAKHTSSYAYIVISLLTYSTTEPANPPSRPLFFTLLWYQAKVLTVGPGD